MPERGEVLDRAPGATAHVHEHGRHAPDPAVDDDEGHLGAEPLDRLVGQAGTAQQHAVDLLGEGLDQLLLDLAVLVGVGHEDVIVTQPGLCLRGLDQRREERVGDVGHDEADVVGAPGGQRPRGAVGPVAQAFGDGEHAGARLLVDLVGRGECARHRGDVYPRCRGHVTNCHRHARPPWDRFLHSSAIVCTKWNGHRTPSTSYCHAYGHRNGSYADNADTGPLDVL
jgi:hypothetical protein